MADETNPFLAAPSAGPTQNPFLTPTAPAAPATNNPFLTPTAPPEQEEEGGFWSRVGDRIEASVDTATDIGEGITSGAVRAVEGLVQAPAIAIDLAFDTDTSRSVTDFFQPVREFVSPEGTAGKVAEDIVAYGLGFVPIAGWLSRASQVARGAKAVTAARGSGVLSRFMRSADEFGSSAAGRRLLSSRTGLIGSTALGSGAYSFMVTPDGRATLSDSFDVLPEALRTEEDTGLRGRDEALRLLRNRGRQFVEDAALSGVFDTALSAFGVGARQIARVPQVAAAANAFDDALTTVGTELTKRFPKAVSVAREYFTPSGGADRLLYEEAEDARSFIQAEVLEATRAANELKSVLGEVTEIAGVATRNPQANKRLQADISNYLEGSTDTLPSITDDILRTKITDRLDTMRNILTKREDESMYLLENIARDPRFSGLPRQKLAQEAYDILRKNRAAQRNHLRRVFEVHTNPVKFYKNLDLESPLAKEAQQEVAANIASMEGLDVASEAVQQRAKATVLNALKLKKPGAKGLASDKALIKEALDRARDANKGRGKLGSAVFKERPEFVTDGSLFTKREQIVDDSPRLRQLMGEVTDPINRFTRTIEDTTRAFVADNFFKNLAPLGLEKSLAQGVEEFRNGLRPAVVDVPNPISMTDEEFDAAMQPFRDQARELNIAQGRGAQNSISPTDVVEAQVQELLDQGYIQLGSADAVELFGGLYGAASGKLVSPETYRALTAPLRLGDGVFSEVLGTLSGLRNFTQKMTIVPNPAAQVRGFLGNIGFLAGNGNLPAGGDVTDLLFTFVANVDEMSEAGVRRLDRKLSLTGVRETNLVTRALKEYKQAADDLTFSGTMNRMLDQAEGAIPFMRGFEALYTNQDSFFKGAALLAEESKYRTLISKIPGLSENDPLLLESLKNNGLLSRAVSMTARELDPVEMMATEIVKDTMPIYPRVVKAVRAVDALPVIGNFTSFAAENVRNSIGTVLRGVKEGAYETGPALREKLGDYWADQLELGIRALGTQRLLAYSSVSYFIPKTLVKMSMQATGTTPEEMAALYEMNPEYLDGHDLVILENNRDKKYIDYIDLSYVMPYAFMTDPAQAAIREIQENGRAGKGTIASTIDGVWRGFQMFADPFASETMFYERLRDVMPENVLFGRGGQTATGAQIYGPNENIPDVALKSFNHLMFGFVPNVATMLVEESNGQLREGRLLRAYTGTPDRQGETTNPSKEIARLVTGFTPMRLNMVTDARYKGSEYLPLRSDSRSRALRAVSDAAATPESIEAAWNTYLDELYRAQSTLYRSVESMRALGMTQSEIEYALITQAGLGRQEAISIIDGRFNPSVASRENIEMIQNQLNREGRTRLVEEVDFGRLSDLSSNRMDEPLRTAPESRPEVLGPRRSAPATAPNPFMVPTAPQPQQSNPFTIPTVPPQGSVVPAPMPLAPAMPMQASITGPVSPALLGETPVEQAANLAIAQRTGRA